MKKDTNYYKRHIKTLNLKMESQILKRKEINELPNIIAPDETIDNIVNGAYGGGLGILVSTNRRLVFIDKGMLYGLKVEDFPLDKVSSIQYNKGMITASIKIYTSGNTAVIDGVEKQSAQLFSEFVREKISSSAIPEKNNSLSENDIISQLERLGNLKEKGILTDEEFSEQKAKLLAKL